MGKMMKGKLASKKKAKTVAPKTEPEIDLDVVVRLLSAELQERYGEPEEGRHRRVYFDRENHEVIKVPFHESGISANYEELDTQGPIYARTSLDEELTAKYKIPVLRMEEVDVSLHYLNPDLPGWVDTIDCRQVGYTKDGRLVAFDWDRY